MMHTLLANDRLAAPGKPDVYLEVIDPYPRRGSIKVFDAEKREDKYVEALRIQSDIYANKLVLFRAGKPRYSQAAQPDDAQLHERIRFIHAQLREIHRIQKLRGLSFIQAYQLAAGDYERRATPASPAFPARSTMYRYRQDDRAGLPVLRGDKNKGNRDPRYPKEVVSAIMCSAQEHYLVPHSRWSLTRLTEDVNRQVHGTVIPSYQPRISAKYVNKIIRKHLSSDPEHDRMRPSDAIAGKSIAKERIRIEAPFERVEQDALHLPFVVETPGGISSNVYLVHAIDCCTGYPLGWQLVVGAPTDSDSLACIEKYMTPTKGLFFRQMGIDHDLNIYGTPGELVFDNGPETKTNRIERLEKLGVDVTHCRARSGHEKPFIERLNRSLKEALESLAGCTRRDGKDGKRDPVAMGDTLIDLETLERWIVRWYYEKWIHTPLQRLRWEVLLDSVKGDTPSERIRYFQDTRHALPLPPSRADWLSALYDHVERQVSRKTGITIDGMHYKGDEIEHLVSKYGESTPLHVLFNPDDFRHIYVDEGDERPLVRLTHEHVRPETPAWSFSEAREQFKRRKLDFKRAPEADKFDHDLHAKVVADSHAPKRRRPSVHDRNREAAQRAKEIRANLRAARNHSTLLPKDVVGHPGSPFSVKPTSPPLTSMTLDEAPLLQILDRNSGADLI